MRTQWGAIGAVFSGGLVAGACIGKVPPALPGLRESLGLSLVEAGFIATMLNVMGMLAGIGAGVLCDRLGHKRLALAGLVTMAAGGFLGALSWGFAPLLAARFIEGAGFIVFTVSGAALMTAAAGDARDRARALALWSAYMPTGGATALLLAPLLIATMGWRGLWSAVAIAALVSCALVARYAPAPPQGTLRSMRLVREALRQPGNIALAVLFAFYVAQWTSVMIWLPTFAVEQRGASQATGALLAAAMVVANIPGNLGGGWLLARGVPRGRLVIVAALVAALCEIGMLQDGLPDALRFALVLVFSAVAGTIPAAIFAGLPVHAPTPQHIGTGNGFVMQTSQAGQFFGPVALAWIASRFGGWHSSLGLLLVFAACCVGCGIALGRIEARRES